MAITLPLTLPEFPPGRYVELPGRGRTFVREIPGPRGAPTLVLLHGWTATAALNWHNVMPALARSYHVLAVDLRGHGRGLRTRAPFLLEDCADDVAALLDVLGIDRAVMVGYSMGGPVAQLTWRRHPGRVSGMVLCATAASFPIRLPLMIPLAALGRGLSLLPAALVRNRPLPMLASIPQLRLFDELARSDTRMLCQAGLRIHDFDSTSWVGEIDVPCSVLLTLRDELVPPRSQRELAAALQNATVHTVAGEHFVAGRRPDLFETALLAACADVTGRRRAARPAPTSRKSATVLPLPGGGQIFRRRRAS